MSRTPKILLSLLACAALGLPAAASHNTVRAVKIAVIDPRTNQELATLAPGQSFELRQARQIAESRESEIDLYQKGTCNQQRLLALYKQLLGRESAQIDQSPWRAQLDHLGRGDIAEVADDLVGSREFQERFGLQTRSGRL